MAEKEWEGEFDPMDDPEERQHLLSVLDSFRSYRRLAHFNGTHVRRQAFYSLPREHWTLLSQPPFSLLSTFNHLDDLIDANASLAEAIFCAGFKAFLAPTLSSDWVASLVPEKYARDEFQIYSLVMDNLSFRPAATDTEKARSCINQFYREWSSAGAIERSKCFDPILSTLDSEFTSRLRTTPGLDKSDLHILIPGAGLGRLVFDVCLAGFSVQGNEISYHELMASSLVLNHMEKAEQFTIAPFALNSSNHLSRADQFQTFPIPDIHPATALLAGSNEKATPPAHERMSMATGDFCVLYSQPDSAATFDAVATVFFIDTAPNLIRYIDAVRNCLKQGGLWINLGPLLWHHASRAQRTDNNNDDDNDNDHHHHHPQEPHGSNSPHVDSGIASPGSVELTNDEVLALVQHMGFTVEKHVCDAQVQTGYISNPRSMLQSTYRPVFWVARKK